MALKPEIMGLELKRIAEDIRRLNSISKPLASLDENTCGDVHAEPHDFITAESRSLLYSNKRHTDDSVVKATIMWKPVGDNVKEEPNELRFVGSTVVTQQSRKPFTTTNLYKKATHGEKENLESGSCRARGFLNSNSNAALSGSTDGKRLQDGFDILGEPVTRLEINIVDGRNEAVGGPGLSIGDGKPVNEAEGLTIRNGRPVNQCKSFARKVSAGPSIANLEKIGVYSQQRQPDFWLEDSLCFARDSSIQTSILESREGAQPHIALVPMKMKETSHDFCPESPQSMKTRLLSQFEVRSDQNKYNFTQKPKVANMFLLSALESPLKSTQNYEDTVCDVLRHCPVIAKSRPDGQFKAQNMRKFPCLLRPEFLKIPVVPVVSQSKFQSSQDVRACEKISIENNDHLVFFFSEQEKRSAGRAIRQELSKLSSLCIQYLHSILFWIARLRTEKNIRGCLRRLRQIFSRSPRGFVNLYSKKLPEFSTKASSLSSNRKLAKDKELKAVLLKINEVLMSMERTSLDSMQERKPNFVSLDGLDNGVKAAGSCSQHDWTAFATIGA